MKEVLITGANSYVGARIYYDLRRDFGIVGTYHNFQLSSDFVHLDITNPTEVKKVVEQVDPATIVHVAANASAKWCEDHPNWQLNLLSKPQIQLVRELSLSPLSQHLIHPMFMDKQKQQVKKQ